MARPTPDRKYHPLLIFGGRDFHDTGYMHKIMNKSLVIAAKQGIFVTFVLTGVAPGADKLGRSWAYQAGLPTVDCPYWSHLGGAGGSARNAFMAEFFQPAFAVGFPGGPGTENMWSHVRRLHIPHVRAESLEPWQGNPQGALI